MEQLLLIFIVVLSAGYIYIKLRKPIKEGVCSGCPNCSSCSLKKRFSQDIK